jgi:hypothetical protein
MEALWCAVKNGWLQLPKTKKRPGPPSMWKGRLGLELVQAVEALRMEAYQTARNTIIDNLNRGKALEAIKSLWAGTGLGIPIRRMSAAKAIATLQDRDPAKWGVRNDLEKRFYEAKKFWGYGRRLAVNFDPWHENHPEVS